MNSEGLLKFFHTICTDNNPKIPPQIRLTPTLIIKGIPVPYVAADAFAWFSKIKQWKINLTMQQASNAQQQHLQTINGNLGSIVNDSNVLEFSRTEMEGLSDIFAYIREDNAMPHSYVSCNNLGNESIFVLPFQDDKISTAKQQELQTNLEAARKKQDALFKKTMDAFRDQYKGV